ncbi:(S)-ureidoglycine aminohydrolase [Desulfosporosinus nitroreducens]|uniref:(S)-ureidoglycine aminohydrolase n=1 Tax=Desulfosporosinus nitroreducens TaxID=2018668 RepID=A0ABT8QNJ3_9FIRM|nr:(S)-ureidoglycine aminohydrolase [Desulfosporosinus nitroreducens]MCO1603608.1 (S)-ureidoglycine aminohydrolase [Desulfosporosinus nitroreducens]MDO0822179.1 (S)-ureidoglycine aminohydrolase [Desulfosporosinus nitroreducens]
MGYPNDLLATRAIIKHGRYAVIPPEGRVNNVIPNLENCKVSIIASPELGTKFAFYTVDVQPGGGTTLPFQEEGIETFVFCINGQGTVQVEDQKFVLQDNGYVFAPASQAVSLTNQSEKVWRLLLYKQRYRKLEGYEARVVLGNLNDLPNEVYDDMDNVLVRNLLPADLGFDVNFHTLTFHPGGSHPFVETHQQEHGLYFLEGDGVYLIDDKWLPVKEEDFIWFGPYVPQAFYCSSRKNACYIYTKDCNRDVKL